MELELITATLQWEGYIDCLMSWGVPIIRMENSITGQSLMESYQTAVEQTSADILGFIHDDLICNDPDWLERVMREFSDETVGLVGFAGATGHGSHDLYTAPYKLSNLGRSGFKSNMQNAESHGERFTGSCDVAVLDGLALFVRRELLVKCGGWPTNSMVGYIGYDYWISCMARRHGYRIRLVGCAIDHLGGKSTGLNPKLGDANFAPAHFEIYSEFRDVLPFEVKR